MIVEQFIEYEEVLQGQLQELLNSHKPIVIFGASVIGICAKKTLDFLGKSAVCFCDNDENKHNTTMDELSVLSPEKMKELYPDAKIYLCLNNVDSITQVKKQLENLGFLDICSKDVLLYMHQIEVIKRPILSADYAKILHALHRKDNKLVLNHTLVILTDRCSLRCRDCGHLVPYYKSPEHYDKNQIIRSIKILSDAVDNIELLSVLGGEPLLHPDVGEICEEIAKIKNIRTIRLVTNGTILPGKDVLERLRRSITYVVISNYGVLSGKKELLQESLKQFGIVYEMTDENTSWYPISLPSRNYRSEKENSDLFETCAWGRGCSAVQNGEYHLCNYSATGGRLGFISNKETDYVNLLDEKLSPKDIREKLRNLIESKDYITACDYCNFDFSGTIPCAVQMKE
ncbi:MAG: radical SAM protein [Bacillota bacterium]